MKTQYLFSSEPVTTKVDVGSEETRKPSAEPSGTTEGESSFIHVRDTRALPYLATERPPPRLSAMYGVKEKELVHVKLPTITSAIEERRCEKVKGGLFARVMTKYPILIPPSTTNFN